MIPNNDDTWFLITSGILYTIGRASYSPSLAQQWCKDNWSIIPYRQKTIIQRDVRRALRDSKKNNTKLGMDMDHQSWVDFLDWIEDEETPACQRDDGDGCR